MIHLGDITKIRGDEIPPVDCITGGSPCQDLSVAGKRAGLEGERSGLFMEQIRIVKEMRNRDIRNGRAGVHVRPRFMVWENVPGAFSSNGGKDFQAVLTEIVKIVEPDAPPVPLPDKGKWPKAGCLYSDVGDWSVAWRVHDAQFWGVPQRRKRIALVADFAGLAAPEVCFVRAGLSRDPESRGAERQGAAAAAQGGAGTAGQCLNSWDVQSKHIQTPDGVAESLYAGECRHGGGESYVMDEQPILLESNQNNATVQTNGVSTALPASMGMGGGYVPMVTGGAISFQERAGKPGGGKGILIQHEHVGALSTLNNQSVISFGHDERSAKFTDDEIIDPLTATDYKDPPKVTYASVVRRLTPLECERLQGYPDGWTDIGDWVDSKGKKHKAADSPRYKALGNSIALPFWFWLLRRISAQYERPATLGSLFDGIGGFPLCWERCNGKDTAIWASEIEEFPIAVTKKHFPEEKEDT